MQQQQQKYEKKFHTQLKKETNKKSIHKAKARTHINKHTKIRIKCDEDLRFKRREQKIQMRPNIFRFI